MILIATWLQSTTGEPIRFANPEAAWNFLTNVKLDVPSLTDRRVTDWYPDETYTGGFQWHYHGNSADEYAQFAHFWHRTMKTGPWQE